MRFYTTARPPVQILIQLTIHLYFMHCVFLFIMRMKYFAYSQYGGQCTFWVIIWNPITLLDEKKRKTHITILFDNPSENASFINKKYESITRKLSVDAVEQIKSTRISHNRQRNLKSVKTFEANDFENRIYVQAHNQIFSTVKIN